MSFAMAVSLLVAYAVLGAFVTYQLCVLKAQRHNPFSYKSIFNALALLWMCLRSGYWGAVTTDAVDSMPDWAMYMLFWSPHCILYTTFATLALFFAKVINRRSWTGKYRNRFILLYGLFGGADICGTIALSILAGTTGEEQYANIESCGNAVLFLFLAGAFTALGYQFRSLNAWEYSRMFVFHPRTLSIVAFVLAAVFLSRCIFNFITFTGLVTVDVTSDDYRDILASVGAYVWWEFFPLILLLSTVAAAPQSNTIETLPKEFLNFGVFGAIAHMDDDTGDSGDEEERMGTSETSAMLTSSMSGPLSAPTSGLDTSFGATSSVPATKAPRVSTRPGAGLGVSGGLLGGPSTMEASSGGSSIFSGGLGRPGGYAGGAHSLLSGAGDAAASVDTGSVFSHGSGMPPRSAGGMSAAGFLAAQQNAMRRTMYIAPGMNGAGATPHGLGSAASPTYGGASSTALLAHPSVNGSAPVTPMPPLFGMPASYASSTAPPQGHHGITPMPIGTLTGSIPPSMAATPPVYGYGGR